MQKFRKKIIVFAVVFFLGFFVFGQVDAVVLNDPNIALWEDNSSGVEVVYLGYDENDVLVLTFTYNQWYDNGDGVWVNRGGFEWGALAILSEKIYGGYNQCMPYMQFSEAIVYGGDCQVDNFGEWGDPDGIYVDAGDYCTIAFGKYNNIEAQGVGITREEIGDPPFFESYSLPYYITGLIAHMANYSWEPYYQCLSRGCTNSEPIYDLIPWGETPEPPEPDPINAECGSDAGKTFYGVSGPENFCEKGDFSWNDLDYNAETQTWTWICTGQHGGANTFCNAYWQAEAPPQVINAECGAFSYLESIDEADFFPNSPVGKCEKGIYRPDTFVSGSIGGSWVCSGVPYLIGESVRCSVRWSETLGDQIIPVPDIEYEDCDSYNIPEKWICQIRNFLAQAFLPSSEKLNSLNENIENIKNKAPFNYITAFTETLEAVQDDLSDEPIQMSLLGNQGTLNLEGWQIPALFRKMFLVIFLIGFIVWAVNYIKRIF